MKHSISTGYVLLANHIPVLMDLLTLSPIDYYLYPTLWNVWCLDIFQAKPLARAPIWECIYVM